MVGKERFDAIITDLIMPNLNGASAVEISVLLNQRERIGAPVLALRFHDVGVRE